MTMAQLRSRVTDAFHKQFSDKPKWLVRAPGRVNLIGEHTDYNDGFVMPMAIDRQILIALRPRSDHHIVVHSLDYDEKINISSTSLAGPGESGWGEYVKGVVWALQRAGHQLMGWEGVMSGDIPKGAGLSSSAALELAVAKACSLVSDFAWLPVQMATIGQQAENEWVGMQCGIMDQMISACGRADHALMIDCRSLESTPVPLPDGTAVVVMDTGTRRGLVDSAYNERRRQCHDVAGRFDTRVLRDVGMDALDAICSELTAVEYRRARHVISENARVQSAMRAMGQKDAGALGKLMTASHNSLRDDFEVSSRELNIIVDCALAQSECYGARMTGAGFGGCAVALIDTAAGDTFTKAVAGKYLTETAIQPTMYLCRATNGTEVI